LGFRFALYYELGSHIGDRWNKIGVYDLFIDPAVLLRIIELDIPTSIPLIMPFNSLLTYFQRQFFKRPIRRVRVLVGFTFALTKFKNRRESSRSLACRLLLVNVWVELDFPAYQPLRSG